MASEVPMLIRSWHLVHWARLEGLAWLTAIEEDKDEDRDEELLVESIEAFEPAAFLKELECPALWTGAGRGRAPTWLCATWVCRRRIDPISISNV
jgi:hypothetical protein